MTENNVRRWIQNRVKRSEFFWKMVDRFPDLIFQIKDDKISRSRHGVEIWNRGADNVYEHTFFDRYSPKYAMTSAGTKFVDGVSEPYKTIELENPVGGAEEFFKSGSRLLELGCGGGQAAVEFADLFPEVDIVAIDMAFGKDIPMRKSRKSNLKFESVDWNIMPYEDGTFDSILSYEGVAKYGNAQSAKEVTRVAKIGCIFRGTKDRGVIGYKGFVDALVEEGWDVYSMKNQRFVAIYRGPDFKLRK